MFNTPIPQRRHLDGKRRSCRVSKRNEMKKEDPAHDVPEKITDPEPEQSGRSGPATTLKNSVHGSKSNATRKSINSVKSLEARKKQLEFEAAEAQAVIAKKEAEIEKQLIVKKLAADLAALDSQSGKSKRSSNTTEVNSVEKVQQWLERSHISEKQGQLSRDGGSSARGADFGNLATAINESNAQNKQLISRLATSRDLPQFFGDPLEWLAFKQAYDESTDFCNFSDAENMWRLRKSLRGEAKETVSSLLIGNTAPYTIIEALELRYGRPETIINKITVQLKKIPPLSHNYHHEIVSFSIKIKNFVAAVQAIKQADYLRSPEIVTSVLSKCPGSLINKWADYYSINCDAPQAKLEILSNFLYSEAIKVSSAGLSHIHSQPDYRKKPEERKIHSVLLQNKPVDAYITCKFCRTNNHSLPNCARFKRAMRKDRWRFVRVHKLCHKCLLEPHNRDTCSAAACDCDGCGLPHHRLLHWKPKAYETREQSSDLIDSDNLPTSSNNVLFSANKVTTSDDGKIMNNICSEYNETVAHSISNINSRVFLKVVPIDIQGPSGKISTYALLDDGATVSLIAADVADQVNLHGHKQRLSVRGAWNSELTCDSEVVNFNIINKNNQTFELSARKISELNLPSQTLSHIKLQKYEHLQHLEKYCMCSDNLKPKLLIGQDNYNLIMPLKTIFRGKNEPCATLTPLGWCVHGVCPIRPHISLSRETAMVTAARYPVQLHCESRHHACMAPVLTDKTSAPLPPPAPPTMRAATHTSACEISDDYVTCAETCLLTADAIHTGSKNDRLYELVKRSFTFESIGVCNKPRTNKDELRAIEIVENSAKLRDGKWEVGLPWKDHNSQMTDSYFTAFRRLKTVEKKMANNLDFASKYKERINHLLDNDYARKLEQNEDGNPLKLWYLPHFGVENANKKRLRLVFDGKATSEGHSLNDYLLQGPDLLESLLGIMLRFRERPIGLTGDIKDMFLRVKIRPEDQHALRFLWRDSPDDPVQKYVMTSLIFGANSSPFVAQYIKNKNAQRFVKEMPEAVAAIIKNHYMDDYIDCFDTIETAQKTMKDVSYIHQKGDFEIRNWTSNEPAVCQNVPRESLSEAAVNFKSDDDTYSERTLGLLWYPNTDTFGFNLSLSRIPEKILNCERKPTKRELLSIVMSIFDIYGFLTPFTIQAKIIIQNTWQSDTNWNDEIGNKQFILFKNWISQLEKIRALRIPRWYFRYRNDYQNSASETIDLHLLCDASPSAYAAVAYWRVHTDNENVCVSFVASKSRVAPIKLVSIPRLELQAAVLACRLADTIRKETRIVPAHTYYWSDSMTVLHWIKNDTRSYKTFVANRLGEIDDLSKADQWNYLPSEKNIADIATKNNNYELQNDGEWFRGPNFLYLKDSEWLEFVPKDRNQRINVQTLEMIHHVNAYEHDILLPVPDPARFSSWLRILRSTAYVLLFTEKCKKNYTAEIHTNMLQRAENLLLRYAQRQSFATEIQLLSNNTPIQPHSRLRTLTPYIDESGLLRAGGRVGAVTNVCTNVKCPIILDGAHEIARLLVKHYHERYAHGNNEIVVNELRQKYWLLSLRPTVRTVAAKCQYCRIRKAAPMTPRMADLPPARLAHHQRPFTHCGVDLFGPIEITVCRRKERRYGVLFTCMTVRCIHIELAASLTTDSFIMALRRMACRRGWPQHIYSDNGTNLRGADAELKKSSLELDQSTIKQEMTNRGVSWTFISPISPHKAGSWERLIRSVKVALRVVLKERAPREETLITLLAEVENIVNSRPLTHVSVDPKHMEALTPNHFLIGSSSNLPIPGVFDDGDLYLRKMWRTAQRLTDMFWQRWVKEFLPDLIPRQKWYLEADNLKKGDLVIVVDPNFPRNIWPKGKIERVYPGKDGRVRTVDVITKTGILTRPVTRLALVPMAN